MIYIFENQSILNDENLLKEEGYSKDVKCIKFEKKLNESNLWQALDEYHFYIHGVGIGI